MDRRVRSLVWKTNLLFGGFFAVIIGGFVLYTAHEAQKAVEQSFGLALERIVATAAIEIDGDEHALIRTREDTNRPEFKKIREHLRLVQRANYLEEDLLYTFRIVDERTMVAAVMLQAEPYTGDPYHMVEQNVPLIREVIEKKESKHTKLYTDVNDTWISAYAPIVDGSGKVVGILEADYRLSKFIEELSDERMRLLGVSLAALALAVFAITLFVAGLRRDLQRILQAAEHIEMGDYAHRIELRRNDELGLVARQFNRMAEVLFERFHMLKFLPRHTLEAIQRRAKEGEGRETERVEASIFFSDIRGYTKMSEGLSDEAVVRMLNTYLRRQAEILEEHGGTIDKYIGDAVLAVFVGDEHAVRAARAAKAIQEEVSAMNARRAFEREVHIGIGVATGGLVLAEVGSEGRKERTIIGSTVNLASRLCSHAAADEVVVSAATFEALPGEMARGREERVPLKGFSTEQRCYVLAA